LPTRKRYRNVRRLASETAQQLAVWTRWRQTARVRPLLCPRPGTKPEDRGPRGKRRGLDCRRAGCVGRQSARPSGSSRSGGAGLLASRELTSEPRRPRETKATVAERSAGQRRLVDRPRSVLCLVPDGARAPDERAWPVLSESGSPGGAGEAAALVLATQEFVANCGGRPSDRRRRSAASPGRTGSRGRVGRHGCCVPKRKRQSARCGRTRLLDLRESGSDAVGAERCRNCSDAVVSTGLPLGTSSAHVVDGAPRDRNDRGAAASGSGSSAAPPRPSQQSRSQPATRLLRQGCGRRDDRPWTVRSTACPGGRSGSLARGGTVNAR
jgi:hypothetical protein